MAKNNHTNQRLLTVQDSSGAVVLLTATLSFTVKLSEGSLGPTIYETPEKSHLR